MVPSTLYSTSVLWYYWPETLSLFLVWQKEDHILTILFLLEYGARSSEWRKEGDGAKVQNSSRRECEQELIQDSLRNGVENSAEIRKHKSVVAPICGVVYFSLAMLGNLHVGIEKMDYWRNWEFEVCRGYMAEGKGLRKLKVLTRERLKWCTMGSWLSREGNKARGGW